MSTLLRILTYRDTEYCGKVEQHDYELYLAVNDIEHTITKAYSPQANGICQRFHKTLLEEFYQTAFRTKIYNTLEELQLDLDEWVRDTIKMRHERYLWLCLVACNLWLIRKSHIHWLSGVRKG